MDADTLKCITKLLSNYLTLHNSSIIVTVTAKQVYGYGLVILMSNSDLIPQKMIEWIKRHIAKKSDIMKNSTEVA